MNNNTFLDSLNPKQRAAAEHLTGPALVLAGAGSGKTRVLTSRVAHLLQTIPDLHPSNIMLVTFTNKAAAEMKNRVRSLTGLDLPFSGTFHSFSTRVLRRHAVDAGLDQNFSIYDADDQLALLKTVYQNNGWDPKEFKPQAIKAAISNAKNAMQSPEDYRRQANGDYGEFVANAYECYQRELHRESALDFDDLLNFTYYLLRDNPSVRQFYQKQIRFLLIDEYQDTNRVQYLLSKILAAPDNNLFVVGDFSQSIYAWRGADYRNMLNLQKDFPDLQTYHLDQNYRSHQNILTAATQIIQKNTDHPILNLWTEDKSPQKLTLAEAETGNNEANFVAENIQKLQTDYPLSEIAILYRTNAQSRPFEEALTRHRLPYKLIGGFKFYERKEIKDLLAYLRYFFNPKESVSLKRLTKIGKRRLNAYLDWKTTYQANPDADLTPLKILQEVLTVTKYRDLYDPGDPEEAVKLENINELLSHASQFSDALTYLENVSLIQDDYFPDGEQPESERAQVSLMSLHSAKGLEFSVVFMVGMEENLLPHSRSLFDANQLSEERRLCYVGITRAKQKLFFTCARRRWQYGITTTSTRSRFLDDLAHDLLEITRLDDYSEPGSNFNQAGHNRFPNPYNRFAKHQSQDEFAPRQDHSFNPKPKPPKPISSERRLVLDENADSVLHDDLDFETFLHSWFPTHPPFFLPSTSWQYPIIIV